MSDKRPFVQTAEVAIDSAKIRIPLDLVTVLDEDLLESEWGKVNFQTGTVKEEAWKAEAMTVEREDGAKVRYKIEKGRGLNSKVTFVTIGINAKVLGADYQLGICGQTLDRLLLQIQQDGVIELNRDSLLQGRMTDTDLKLDFVTSDKAMEDMIPFLKRHTKNSNDLSKGAKRYNTKTNKGIHWNTRESATPSAPYVKIYSKAHEFSLKSKVFADTYFADHDLEGVWRLEGTVKDSKHWERYGVKDYTLGGLLSLSHERLQSILMDLFKLNLDHMTNDQSKTEKIATDLNATTQVYLGWVVDQLELGRDTPTILTKFTNYVRNPRSKKNIRQQVVRLLNMIHDGDESTQDVPDKIRRQVQSKQDEIERLMTDILQL